MRRRSSLQPRTGSSADMFRPVHGARNGEGSAAWPATRGGKDTEGAAATLCSFRPASLMSLTQLCCLARRSRPWPGASSAAVADPRSEILGSLRAFDPHNAIYLCRLLGLVAFSTTTALVLLCANAALGARANGAEGRGSAAARRRGSLRAPVRLRAPAPSQLARARRRTAFDGDPSIAGDGATAKRALAFGTWLPPATPPPWRPRSIP